MSNRLVKYSLVTGLALLLAAPAVAYSQYSPPQPGQNRFAGTPPRQGPDGPQGPTGAGVRGPASRRARGYGAGRGGFGPGLSGRGIRSSLAARALAQGDRIGLTAEQRDQILAAQRSAREVSINRRADSEIAQLELRDLMTAEARDVAAVEAKLRELAEFRIAEQVDALRLDETVRGLLSSEQIDELGDLSPGPRGNRPGRRAAPRRNPR